MVLREPVPHFVRGAPVQHHDPQSGLHQLDDPTQRFDTSVEVDGRELGGLPGYGETLFSNTGCATPQTTAAVIVVII
jgi:hypothetical protein